MKIEEAPEFRQELLEKIQQREFSERTGIHQSDLTYCLNRQAFRKLYPLPVQDHEILLYSIGWSTQAFITGKFYDVNPRTEDGITVTCDAVLCPACGAIIE